MTDFEDSSCFDVEFESEPVEYYTESSFEYFSGLILNWLLVVFKRTVSFIFFRLILPVLQWILLGVKRTIESMWKKATDAIASAFGKVIGYFVAIVLIVAFSMSFTANRYSLSKTFSWSGITTLYNTWK